MKRHIIYKTLCFSALLVGLSGLISSCGGSDVKKDAKLLVSKMVDGSRTIEFEYDAQNRLVAMLQDMRSDMNGQVSDSLFYDDAQRVVSRKEYYNLSEPKATFSKFTSYKYSKDTIIVNTEYTNDLPSLVDTLVVNDKEQLMSDKFFKYSYDKSSNGNDIMERVVNKHVAKVQVNNNIRRFEYDSKVSPFVNLELPDWFIVHQLYLFEYVGDNAPKSVIHEVVSVDNDTIKVISSDKENMKIIYNNANYPTSISGEDDADGKWEVKFEYKEMLK